jgi:16S rRNA (guanine966-N2)-methyltransferase
VTRIVAGSAGGRRLAVPPGRDTRPTSDRVREALFSTLGSLTEVEGCRFVDLYAGSGAVGLEAASRGASAVLLVESGKAAARTVRDNIAILGLDQTCRLSTATVCVALAMEPAEPYDVVFADPPYGVDDRQLAQALAMIVEKGWLAPAGVVVVERSIRSPEPTWPDGITTQRARRYGDTVLWYGRRARADHEGWPGGRR